MEISSSALAVTPIIIQDLPTTSRYSQLIRETAFRTVERSTVSEMPFVIDALKAIAESGLETVIASVKIAATTGDVTFDLPERIQPVIDLFDYEVWGVDSSNKEPFYQLIKSVCNETASFFSRKTTEERTSIVALETKSREAAILVRDKLKEKEAGAGTAEIAILAEDEVLAGREAILMSIEDLSVRTNFINDCADAYGKLYESEEGKQKYKMVITGGAQTIQLLVTHGMRASWLFQLHVLVLKEILAEPMSVPYLLSRGLTESDIIDARIPHRIRFMCQHASKIAALQLTRNEILTIEREVMDVLLAHQEAICACIDKHKISRGALFKSSLAQIVMFCNHLAGLDTLFTQHIDLYQLKDLPNDKLEVVLTRASSITAILQKKRIHFHELCRLSTEQLSVVCEHAESIHQLDFVKDKRLITEFTPAQLRELLTNPTSTDAATIRDLYYKKIDQLRGPREGEAGKKARRG